MYILGKLVQWLGLPGFVRPFRFYDSKTGQAIEIKTSPLYTKIIVGEQEFYFIRETGKYDGFGGMSIEDAELASECTA